jgi:hypothetical protein
MASSNPPRGNFARDVPLTSAALAVLEAMREILPRRVDGYVFGDPEIQTRV